MSPVAIAGICAYDSNAQGLAQRYFHQALRLAKASGDRGLGAYVIALLVNQSLFMRDYRQAVAFAHPEHETANMTDDRQWREMTADPKFRRVLVTNGRSIVGQEAVAALAAYLGGTLEARNDNSPCCGPDCCQTKE